MFTPKSNFFLSDETVLHCSAKLILSNEDFINYAIYSQISVIRTLIIRNYWVIQRRRKVPTFFSIIYCNKTTDYPKNSIFRSDSSVPIKEIAIKLPFKIRSPNVTQGGHDFFVLVEFDLHTRVIATGN